MKETTQQKYGGRAFHSIVEPHFDFIHQLRQRRKTWQEITELLLTEKGIRVTLYAPYRFYQRRLKRARKSNLEAVEKNSHAQPAHSNAAVSALQPPVNNDQARKPMLAATPQPLPFKQPNPNNMNLNDPTDI